MSSLEAIEGQSNVEIRFLFDAADKDAAIYQNIKMDNLYLTAVPEPSAGLLAAAAGAGILVRRRRK